MWLTLHSRRHHGATWQLLRTLTSLVTWEGRTRRRLTGLANIAVAPRLARREIGSEFPLWVAPMSTETVLWFSFCVRPSKVSGTLETAADGVTCIASLVTRLTASCRRSSLQNSVVERLSELPSTLRKAKRRRTHPTICLGKNSFPSAAVLLHLSPIAGSCRSRLNW
jgi:hypothetical protein